ncbi:tagaturonate reductase [Membranihabitans maritimus]|uniref:tagaturonate reductase n=1 Tax=Membranihabitans maritimus TaxID=2904244 RepID=UPI001F01C8F4|nr:tagaturonate reductase [Membranihabitans maritimus]
MKESNGKDNRVIQFGGGNFLRAFCDWMFQRVNLHAEKKISVTLIKPTPGGDYSNLKDQKGKFHVVVEGLVNGHAKSIIERIDVIDEIIHPYVDFNAFLNSAEDENVTMIVSNTTESGIVYSDEPYSPDHPSQEFPGKLCQWLYHRFQKLGNTTESIVIMPTELIEQNGDTLKKCVVSYMRHWNLEESFHQWLDKKCLFVNTLVDRIVPGYSDQAFHKVKTKKGISDKAVVVCEPYHSLVIASEKNVSKFLPFGEADLNVELVSDLSEYRQKKVRILNGAHTSMVPVGLLNGISTVIEIMNTDWSFNFVKECLLEEVVPTLDGDEEEARKYVEITLERFGNPYLQHKLSDIALNSIAKIRFRLLPSLLSFYNRNGQLPSRIVFSIANWLCIYLFDGFGTFNPKDTSEVLTFFERQKEILDSNTDTLETVVENVLRESEFWGTDLSKMEGLKGRLLEHIEEIQSPEFHIEKYVSELV